MNTSTRNFLSGVGLLAVALVCLGYFGQASAASRWQGFCSQEKNLNICRRAVAQCERNTNPRLTCTDIREIYMRYRGFSGGHIKRYEQEIGRKGPDQR